MRLARVRFTVRRLMAAVAVVAVALGAYVEYRSLAERAARYNALAQSHAGMETTLRAIAAISGADSPVDISPGPGVRSVRFTVRAVVDHEANLKRKYKRAARYPWLSVSPDPATPH